MHLFICEVNMEIKDLIDKDFSGVISMVQNGAIKFRG